MANINIEPKNIYIWVPSVTVDYLLVWWWGWWGRSIKMPWWWGWGWGICRAIGKEIAKGTYSIVIWAWWAGNNTDTLAEMHSWCPSCFWDIVAYWWWWGWPWINSCACSYRWADWWSWWWGGAYCWCWTWWVWWYNYRKEWEYRQWMIWGASYNSCWWWWGWWYCLAGGSCSTSNYWWRWWCWLCWDISWAYSRYWWWWGWWGRCCVAQDLWWWNWWWCLADWCNAPYYWWGGWWWGRTNLNTNCKKWGSWCQWIFILRYPTACWYSITWGTCYTCWDYTIHCFTSNWTLTIN